MKVQLAPELFEPPVSDNALLITFIRYSHDGRHRIDLDTSNPLIAAWVEQQTLALQEEIHLAIDFSAEAEAFGPSHTSVIVSRFPATDFAATPVLVRLQDARAFLETPMALLLEDQVSDRAFLWKMLTDEERCFLEKRIDEGFVRVDHGGGLGPMRTRVLAEGQNPRSHHTHWVLFDSDALRPGIPSKQSDDLRLACGRIPHYQLKRRFVESYLTPQALNAWAAKRGNRTTVRKRFAQLRAFQQLRPEQKHHFNMKSGFEGDSQRIDASSVGDLYDDVGINVRSILKRGFGSNIGELFIGPDVTEAALRRESGWQEMRPVVQDLLTRLR